MGIFSKKSISTEAAQQPQPKNNAMADAMPQDASQQVPVAATPQMQAPLQRPVSAAPQPQPQQATAPDAAVTAPQPQQAAAPVGQMQMPTELTSPIQQYRADQQAMVADTRKKADAFLQAQKAAEEQKKQEQIAASQKIVQEAGAKSAAEQAQGKLAQNLKPSSLAAVPGPQDKPIEEIKPSNYYTKYGNYNWDSNDGDFWKNAKESGLSLRDAINYYNKWQEDNNGKPLDMFEQYALLKRYDPFRSIKEQDEEDERLKRQQKWEKISNVFNHLANLWGTARGANPAQQIESGTDLTKRQQEAVDRVRALRKAAGQDYIDALAAKRADEFRQRQLENEAARLAAQDKKYNQDAAYHNAYLALLAKDKEDKGAREQQRIDDARKANEEKNERAKERNRTAQQNANSNSKRANVTVGKYNREQNSDKIVTSTSDILGQNKQQVTQYVPKKTAAKAAKRKKKLGLY